MVLSIHVQDCRYVCASVVQGKITVDFTCLSPIRAEGHRHNSAPQLGLRIVPAGSVKKCDCAIPATNHCSPRVAQERESPEASSRNSGPHLMVATGRLV